PTAAQVLAHLNSIPALLNNVTVIGPASGPFLVVFNNGQALQNVNPLTETGTATFSVTSSDGGATSTPGLTWTGSAPTAAQVLAYLNGIPALNNNVWVAGAPGGPFTVVYRNGLGSA